MKIRLNDTDQIFYSIEKFKNFHTDIRLYDYDYIISNLTKDFIIKVLEYPCYNNYIRLYEKLDMEYEVMIRVFNGSVSYVAVHTGDLYFGNICSIRKTKDLYQFINYRFNNPIREFDFNTIKSYIRQVKLEMLIT